MFVFNSTMAGKGNNETFSTQRSNSTEHIDAWKKSMDPAFVDVVQKRCNYLLKHYGFDL